ncbi:MAG TPA: 50S ribosomal protein L25, partial [Sphaerochaeta sp.]|nr:50S ribosomal protein L25 [Sphaerochaeta sp.]
MSDNRSLTANERTEDFGSAGARRLLRAGRIPAVIYGRKDVVHISLDAHEFTNKMRYFSETALLKISVGKKEREVLMKTYQEDLIRGEIKHVDFYEITRGQVLRAMVSITLDGNPIGVRDGGVLEQLLYEVEIECLPSDLPEVLSVDVSELGLNENLALGDVSIPKGVTV